MYKTSPDKIDMKLEDKSGSIVMGETDRSTVRKMLGNPIIRSDDWNLDVFRQSATQFFAPYAYFFPVGLYWDTAYRYTLVTYDSNNTVQDIDSDTYNEVSLTSDLSDYVPKACSLKAGNIIFERGFDRGDGVLMLSPESKDSYIEKIKSYSHCTIMIGCDKKCPDILSLDQGGNILMSSGTILIFSYPPGNHKIKVSSRRHSGSETIEYDCKNNEKLYFMSGYNDVNYKIIDSLLRGVTLTTYKKVGSASFIIEKYDDIPEEFLNRDIILWTDGKWIFNSGEH